MQNSNYFLHKPNFGEPVNSIGVLETFQRRSVGYSFDSNIGYPVSLFFSSESEYLPYKTSNMKYKHILPIDLRFTIRKYEESIESALNHDENLVLSRSYLYRRNSSICCMFYSYGVFILSSSRNFFPNHVYGGYNNIDTITIPYKENGAFSVAGMLAIHKDDIPRAEGVLPSYIDPEMLVFLYKKDVGSPVLKKSILKHMRKKSEFYGFKMKQVDDFKFLIPDSAKSSYIEGSNNNNVGSFKEFIKNSVLI